MPLLEGARALAEAGHVPGGSRRNLEDVADAVSFEEAVDPVTRTLLADAQTSGGMLIAVAAQEAERVVAALAGKSPAAAVVGTVTAGEPGRITVE